MRVGGWANTCVVRVFVIIACCCLFELSGAACNDFVGFLKVDRGPQKSVAVGHDFNDETLTHLQQTAFLGTDLGASDTIRWQKGMTASGANDVMQTQL